MDVSCGTIHPNLPRNWRFYQNMRRHSVGTLPMQGKANQMPLAMFGCLFLGLHRLVRRRYVCAHRLVN